MDINSPVINSDLSGTFSGTLVGRDTAEESTIELNAGTILLYDNIRGANSTTRIIDPDGNIIFTILCRLNYDSHFNNLHHLIPTLKHNAQS